MRPHPDPGKWQRAHICAHRKRKLFEPDYAPASHMIAGNGDGVKFRHFPGRIFNNIRHTKALGSVIDI